MRSRLRRRFMIAITLAFALVLDLGGGPVRASDIVSFDVEGVKLGMTVDQAFTALKLLMANNPQTLRDPLISYADCATGHPEGDSFSYKRMAAQGPAAARQTLATVKKLCVTLVSGFVGRTTKIYVEFTSRGDPHAPLAASVELVEPLGALPPRGQSSGDADAFIKRASDRYGAPTRSNGFAAEPARASDDFGQATWCPDDTTESACLRAPVARLALLQLGGIPASYLNKPYAQKFLFAYATMAKNGPFPGNTIEGHLLLADLTALPASGQGAPGSGPATSATPLF